MKSQDNRKNKKHLQKSILLYAVFALIFVSIFMLIWLIILNLIYETSTNLYSFFEEIIKKLFPKILLGGYHIE